MQRRPSRGVWSRRHLVRHGFGLHMAIAAGAEARSGSAAGEDADQTRPSVAARMRSIGRSNHWLYTFARSRKAEYES